MPTPDKQPDTTPAADMTRPQAQTAARANILFAFGVAVTLVLCWYGRDVLLLLYASALFAVVFTPVVRGVQQIRIRGWSPGYVLSIAIIMVGILSLLALFCVFAVPPVLRDLQQAAREAPLRAPEIAARIHRLPFLRDQTNLDLQGKLQAMATTSAGFLISSLPNAAHILGRFFIGIVLTIYFMIEGPDVYAWTLSLVPLNKRVRLDAALQRAEVRMGKWLLAQGSLMLILGVCSFAVFAALHLRYYSVLALLMGLFNIIPVVGAMITVGLALVVAALDGWGKVVGVLVFYGIYAQVENGFLVPKIMKSSVDLAGLAVIVALVIGGTYAGILGAILAVPSAVLVSVLMDEYLVHHDRHGVPE